MAAQEEKLAVEVLAVALKNHPESPPTVWLVYPAEAVTMRSERAATAVRFNAAAIGRRLI